MEAPIRQAAITPRTRAIVQRFGFSRRASALSGVPARTFTVARMGSSIGMKESAGRVRDVTVDGRRGYRGRRAQVVGDMRGPDLVIMTRPPCYDQRSSAASLEPVRTNVVKRFRKSCETSSSRGQRRDGQ